MWNAAATAAARARESYVRHLLAQACLDPLKEGGKNSHGKVSEPSQPIPGAITLPSPGQCDLEQFREVARQALKCAQLASHRTQRLEVVAHLLPDLAVPVTELAMVHADARPEDRHASQSAVYSTRYTSASTSGEAYTKWQRQGGQDVHTLREGLGPAPLASLPTDPALDRLVRGLCASGRRARVIDRRGCCLGYSAPGVVPAVTPYGLNKEVPKGYRILQYSRVMLQQHAALRDAVLRVMAVARWLGPASDDSLVLGYLSSLFVARALRDRLPLFRPGGGKGMVCHVAQAQQPAVVALAMHRLSQAGGEDPEPRVTMQMQWDQGKHRLDLAVPVSAVATLRYPRPPTLGVDRCVLEAACAIADSVGLKALDARSQPPGRYVELLIASDKKPTHGNKKSARNKKNASGEASLREREKKLVTLLRRA